MSGVEKVNQCDVRCPATTMVMVEHRLATDDAIKPREIS